MTRFALPVAALLALLSSAVGQGLRVVPPKDGTAVPKDGKVPVVTWTVEWLLRDDKEATLGDLATHSTFASARAVAAKKLADRGEPGTFWYIKTVVIKAEAELVDPSDVTGPQGRLWKAIQEGVDKKAVNCNQLVRDIAEAVGVPGLKDKRADDMWGYFNTAAEKDGWKEVKGDKAKGDLPAVSAVEAANRLAEEGQLVVGVISQESLNKFKKSDRKDYENGHVFVVAPTGGVDWKTTLTANAVKGGGDGASARYTPAEKVIATEKQRDAVQFFAIPLPKK